MRRHVRWAALAAVLVCGAACGDGRSRHTDQGTGASTEAPRRPHVVLITMDTTRADHIGAYGYSRAVTPSLDALAAQGVVYERAYAVQPVTLPAHASILTGRYPFSHGVRDNNTYALPASASTLAEYLGQAGYVTCAFVSTYVLHRRFGLAQGFTYYNDRFVRPHAQGRLPVDRRAEETVTLAVDWLRAMRRRHRSQPLFLWVHLYDPHAQYRPPEPYASALAHPYDGEIAYMDAWIGVLLRALRDNGLWDDALVMAVADHGESLGEHGERTHGFFVYDATIRVPLIVKYPDGPAGMRVRTPVSQVDLVPTVLETAGLDVRGEGAVLPRADAAGRPDRFLYSETFVPASFGWAPLTAVRDAGHLFVDAPHPELYALRSGRAVPQKPDADKVAAWRERVRALRSRDVYHHLEGGLSEEDVAALEALGYVIPAAVPDAARAGADPKDRVAAYGKYQSAGALAASGAVDAAVSLLEPLVAADPDNERFAQDLARMYAEAGRYSQAESLYRRLADRHPASAVLARERADLYLRWGRLEQAAEVLRAAAAAHPDSGDLWARWGKVEAQLERWDLAAQALEKAMALYPSAAVRNNLGYVRMVGQGRKEEGIALIRQAVAADRDSVEAMRSLALGYARMGRWAAASTWYRKILERVPADIDAMKGVAAACAHMEDTTCAEYWKQQITAAKRVIP